MENGSESSRVQIPPSYLQALENYMCCYPFAETLELYTGRIWSLLLELLKYFLLHRTICKYRGHKGQLHNFYMSFHAILPTLDCRGNQFFISPMKATIIILLKKKTYWSLTPWPYFFSKEARANAQMRDLTISGGPAYLLQICSSQSTHCTPEGT